MEKFYWKGRKIKNDVLFQIKKFLHKRRDKFEKRQEDISFNKVVVKEVVKVLCQNIFIIAMIIFVECLLVSDQLGQLLPNKAQVIQSFIKDMNIAIETNASALTEVLSAVIGVAGVFLGLYCANIMSMYSERYSDAPERISQLFENDIVTNKCIHAITSYLIFSVIVLFMLVLQIDIGIIMLIVHGVKGLGIIVSFGFMSRRTYKFSDTYSVSNSVYKEIYRTLSHLNKGIFFIKDRNFQNHYKQQVKYYLKVLSEVNDYNLEKEEKLSISVENFMKQNLTILYSYWEEKAKVAYDSYWYDDKTVYKKWYKADDSEINIALQTGTLLRYENVKNFLWVEEAVEKMNSKCLRYLISKKSYAGIIRWVAMLEGLSESAVETGNVVYYVDYLYKMQSELQRIIVEEDISLEEEMAMAEHIVVSYLAVLVDIRKHVEKQEEKVYLCDIKEFEKKNWKVPNRYYNHPDIRKLHDGVRAEILLEGKRITPDWYINELVAKHYYEELLQMYAQIDAVVNKYIPELAKKLYEKEKYAGAMIVFAKYSEVRLRVGAVEEVLAARLNGVAQLHKERSIVWQEKPEINITKNFDKMYKEMSNEWCKCTTIFALKNWDTYEEYPDILGACATYLCEILVEAIIDNEFDTFESNYKNLFGVLLLYQEYSRRELIQIKEAYRQNAVLAIYSNPIIEYSSISGYAYLWGEISGDDRWKVLVLEDAKKNVTKNDIGKKMCEILYATRNRVPSFTNRDMVHMNWCQRIDNRFRDNENLSWKRDKFYEVYDGESKLLSAVLSVKGDHDFMNCEAYEIYAVVVLNLILEEKIYKSRDGWEDKYYG